MAVIVLILTILILVLIHELGHFLLAKKFGVKVLEFGFGIPPRIFGKKIGETLLSLNALPVGGFVRLLGEDDDSAPENETQRDFRQKSVWQRIIIVVAGVGMNILLAFLLFYLVLSLQGFKTQLPLITNHNFALVDQKNESVVLVNSVVKGSPADQAGLKSGDRVIALNDSFIESSDQLVNETKDLAGKEIKLTVSDADKENYRTIKVTPRVNPPSGQGPLGVAIGSFDLANLEYSQPWQKLLSGPIEAFNITAYSFEVLGDTISISVKEKNATPISKTVAGPVGITSIVGDILNAQNAMLKYLDFLAVLSLNLAMVNILPFPGLDGGRLLFLLIEAITRKKAHPTVEKYVHAIGLVVLIGLILLVTLSDVKKLIF